MKTAIVTCKCKNKFQDQTLGDGKRIANVATKKGNADAPVARCTVCSLEHVVKKSAAAEPTKGKKKAK